MSPLKLLSQMLMLVLTCEMSSYFTAGAASIDCQTNFPEKSSDLSKFGIDVERSAGDDQDSGNLRIKTERQM